MWWWEYGGSFWVWCCFKENRLEFFFSWVGGPCQTHDLLRGEYALEKHEFKSPFGCAFQPVFRQILNFFFAKIECGLYFLDRFDVLMLKMIFKK